MKHRTASGPARQCRRGEGRGRQPGRLDGVHFRPRALHRDPLPVHSGAEAAERPRPVPLARREPRVGEVPVRQARHRHHRRSPAPRPCGSALDRRLGRPVGQEHLDQVVQDRQASRAFAVVEKGAEARHARPVESSCGRQLGQRIGALVDAGAPWQEPQDSGAFRVGHDRRWTPRVPGVAASEHQLVSRPPDPRPLEQGDPRPREGEHLGRALAADPNPISRLHGHGAQHDPVSAPPATRRSHHGDGCCRGRRGRPHRDPARRVELQDGHGIVPGAGQVVVRPVPVARHLGDQAVVPRLEALTQQPHLVRRQAVALPARLPRRQDADGEDPKARAAAGRRTARHPARAEQGRQPQKQDGHGPGSLPCPRRLRSAASSA